jgi:hypothetical protein
MLAAIALALLVDVPAAAAPAPLREVVYKVSSMRAESLTIGTYGGHVAMPGIGAGLSEPAPSSKNNSVMHEGTLTVDVLGIQQDVIKIRITEMFKDRPTPNSYDAYIASNGLVRFDVDDPSPIARYLAPLFGSKFAASTSLALGDSWHVDLRTNAVDVQNTYTIAGQDGSLLLLNETETVMLTSASGMNYSVRGKLRYKPSLLVPIAGDIDERGNRNTMDSTDEATTTVHFERVSDTLDQTATAAK